MMLILSLSRTCLPFVYGLMLIAKCSTFCRWPLVLSFVCTFKHILETREGKKKLVMQINFLSWVLLFGPSVLKFYSCLELLVHCDCYSSSYWILLDSPSIFFFLFLRNKYVDGFLITSFGKKTLRRLIPGYILRMQYKFNLNIFDGLINPDYLLFPRPPK